MSTPRPTDGRISFTPEIQGFTTHPVTRITYNDGRERDTHRDLTEEFVGKPAADAINAILIRYGDDARTDCEYISHMEVDSRGFFAPEFCDHGEENWHSPWHIHIA